VEANDPQAARRSPGAGPAPAAPSRPRAALATVLARAGFASPERTARAGNRTIRRLLQRAGGDSKTPGSDPSPRRPADADVRELRAYQVQERHLSNQEPDPEMVKRARAWRIENTDLSPDSFKLNVAVVKYRRSNGQTYYTVVSNDPAKLHSETIAIKQIAKIDPRWERTEILEVYTERHPCSNCGPDLEHIRSEIKRLRQGRGQSYTDFRVYYSVPRWEKGANRAADLQAKYVGKLNPPVKAPPEPKPSKAAPKKDNRPSVQIRKSKQPPTTSAPAPTPVPSTKVPAPADSPVVKAPSPEISVPKIDIKAVGKSIGGSLLLFALGLWLGRYTEEAIQDMIKQQLKDMQVEINRRVRQQFEAVANTGWAQKNPRPTWYMYVTIDIVSHGVFDDGLFDYDWGTPYATLVHVFASPVRFSEGEWTDADYRNLDGLWEGNFERVGLGYMIKHHRYTKRTTFEELIAAR
jgi:hypothetical protein